VGEDIHSSVLSYLYSFFLNFGIRYIHSVLLLSLEHAQIVYILPIAPMWTLLRKAFVLPLSSDFRDQRD